MTLLIRWFFSTALLQLNLDVAHAVTLAAYIAVVTNPCTQKYIHIHIYMHKYICNCFCLIFCAFFNMRYSQLSHCSLNQWILLLYSTAVRQCCFCVNFTKFINSPTYAIVSCFLAVFVFLFTYYLVFCFCCLEVYNKRACCLRLQKVARSKNCSCL